MKTLKFTPFNRELYELMYEGLLVTPIQMAPGEKRVFGKILDKVEALGKYKTTEAEVLRTLAGDGGDLNLEDAEYDLLKRALESVQWKPITLRKGLALDDFIAEAGKNA